MAGLIPDRMVQRIALSLVLLGLLSGCGPGRAIEALVPSSSATSTPLVIPPTATSEIDAPVVESAAPSYKVATFYYPWYGNPEFDGEWVHWTQNNHLPPDDIASDYFPALGAYSSNDPAVLAQHMKWLRQAGIGVIITSWWGQGSREDRAVPLLLQTAETYAIQVTFHIEPYSGRTAESLVSDIKYLYEQYGNSPAFFRSEATSRYSPSATPKGMFFIWNIGARGAEGEKVEAEYWRSAMDSVHALPNEEGTLVIANTTDGSWIADGHFDGLYNYATLHLEENGGFTWARSLPPDSLYVPSVIPGFSARRVSYPETTFVPREKGNTYETQWGQALGTGVEPALVTITSFNEWHEGTIIEPPRFGVNDGIGYTYANFDEFSPEIYLHHTRDLVERYLARTWPTPYRMRVQVTTTSDWTTLDILDNGARITPVWIRPERVSVSESATAGFEAGDRLVLTQPLVDANAGKEVEMTWDVMVTPVPKSTPYDLVLQIDRGNLGSTHVTIFNYLGETPVEVQSFEWDQVTTGRNSHRITLPLALLTDQP